MLTHFLAGQEELRADVGGRCIFMVLEGGQTGGGEIFRLDTKFSLLKLFSTVYKDVIYVALVPVATVKFWCFPD